MLLSDARRAVPTLRREKTHSRLTRIPKDAANFKSNAHSQIKLEEIMIIQAILLQALVSLGTADTSFYVFNCSDGETHLLGTRTEFYNMSVRAAEWILQRRVFKIIDPKTGIFNGSFFVAHDNNVFLHTCKKTIVRIDKKAKHCFHGGILEARTETGSVAYVGQDEIIVKKPSKSRCPRSWTRAYIIDQIEADHASFAIAQARNSVPLEDLSNLLNFEDALENLEILLETGADGNQTATVDTHVQRFYKRYISRATTYYGLIYLLYTTVLASVALGLRIPASRSIKLALPFLRRLGDIMSYRRDQLMQRQAERMREIRIQQGLSDPPPIMDFTLAHFQNIYSSLVDINRRLDAISPQRSDNEEDKKPKPKPTANARQASDPLCPTTAKPSPTPPSTKKTKKSKHL